MRFLSIVAAWILHLSADKKSRQRTFDVFAMVLARALALSQIEKHVPITYRADFQR